jgi:hypothetical protein
MANYPKGNGLAKSSNKILIWVIKKLLQDNKNAWHKNIICVLWADKITTKNSISTSPFQIVYGAEEFFPTSLGFLAMILLQEKEVEQNDNQRRINQLVHVQQMREHIFNQSQLHQDIMKKIFDKNTKQEDFRVNDLVLKWDARNEGKGKHGKFSHIWIGPFRIVVYHENNAYFLQEMNGELTHGGPMNGRFLKHYLV